MKLKAKTKRINIADTIKRSIIELTISFLTPGFLPIASAILEPSMPIPIPNPKTEYPIIVPTEFIIDETKFSIIFTYPNILYYSTEMQKNKQK